MNFEEKKFTVLRLVQSFNAGSLLRNPEYQRGEAWSELQKASFIDSIFRSYPLPALFLRVVESPGLEDVPSRRFEIVDGQQRLTALRDFAAGNFSLFEINERSKLRLPKSVRALPAPWAGRFYSDLTKELQGQFNNTEIAVFQVGADAHADEIRDLFIRLQSGTALTRQQIRDAWPGNLGPFIERLAGKLDRHPSHKLFGIIDKRGHRSEEEGQRDYHVTDRQTCAQLLKIFLGREHDPHSYPSVSANELDSMYHEYTDFDASGTLAERFKQILEWSAHVFERAKAELGGKAKFRRLEITAVMMYLQDITKNKLVRIDRRQLDELANQILRSESRDKPPVGKSTAGSTLEKYYTWWRENVCQGIGIRLDSQRAFSDTQKTEVWERDNGICQICSIEVGKDDADYDHYPIPYRDGGKTETENGRLVHRRCHPRGRPLEGPPIIQL